MMKFHPFAERFPLLEGAEREAFKESIRATKGNRLDPIKYRVVKGRKEGLDGRNRLRACQELGFECAEKEVHISDLDAVDFILRCNIHRRHMSGAARKELIDDLRAEGMSTRAIAETVGVSQSTVIRDLEEDSGEPFGSPDSTNQGKKGSGNSKATGKDGKKYPAKKKKSAVVLDGDASEEVITDAEGETVPDQSRAAFKAADVIKGFCTELDSILRRIGELEGQPGFRLIRVDSFRQQIKDAKGNLWANRATHVCPYCHGKKEKCECCNGEGWTAKHVWQQAPGNRK